MTLAHYLPRPSDPAHETVAEAMDAPGPQVWDDMTVEVALSVMASARTGHLIVCDEDGRCTSLVTLAQLTDIRDGCTYTDQVRLREVAHDGGPFASPMTKMAEAQHIMCHHRLTAVPVLDEHGCAVGVLTRSR
ncbi:CBS domain-containing protein [Actinacidiphila glaucinigra]|uniref:CBS domain-containing protein n=1 Tax=Actinacidiphila glaucinigra TaxID=235986 RepID=UPI003796AF3F